jgi:chromate transporter
MEKTKAAKLFKIFMVFFRIGAFTIGGGYAMIPLIEKEVVEKNKWVTEDEIVDVFAIVQSAPGAIAINSSIFIGYKIEGFKGALAAMLGIISPSFFIILIIAFALKGFKDNIYVQKAFWGVRAGVSALVLLSVIKLSKSAIKDTLGIIIAAVSLLSIVVFDIHAILVIISGCIIGLTVYGILGYKRSGE